MVDESAINDFVDRLPERGAVFSGRVYFPPVRQPGDKFNWVHAAGISTMITSWQLPEGGMYYAAGVHVPTPLGEPMIDDHTPPYPFQITALKTAQHEASNLPAEELEQRRKAFLDNQSDTQLGPLFLQELLEQAFKKRRDEARGK